MQDLKCYIDVNFTIAENFARFSDKDKQGFIDNKELMTAMFKVDLLDKLKYFSDSIEGLDVAITFEGNDMCG